jgi:hypothetical protein
VGDFDNDGALDILVSNNGGNANRWLEALLMGTRSNRDGARA